MGVAKNQPVYLEWLRKVEARMHPELAAEERRMTLDLK